MSGTSGKVLPLGAVTYLIHHVFLPPKLPQKDDLDLSHETTLLDVTIASLSAFKDCTTINHSAIIGSAIAMVSSMKTVHLSATYSGGAINEEKLKDALANLCNSGKISHKHPSVLSYANLPDGGTIPLHLRAQNCGVMISKSTGSIHVEAFELSPLNEAIISTKGRLRRTFPGCAIAIDLAIFEQPSFIAITAQTLAKMSHQSAVGTKPKAKKASQIHDEDRDTTHPKIVTELFMGFLRAVGQPVDVSCVAKHTREEVMYKASMYNPKLAYHFSHIPSCAICDALETNTADFGTCRSITVAEIPFMAACSHYITTSLLSLYHRIRNRIKQEPTV